MESLWSSLQDEVYFMNGGVAACLWRHQTWSPSWILYTSFNFFRIKSLKNMHFYSKMAWPHATFDVISRNHSNWPSQNLREG